MERMLREIEKAEDELGRQLAASERVAVTVRALNGLTVNADELADAAGIDEQTAYTVLQAVNAAGVVREEPKTWPRRYRLYNYNESTTD